MNRVLAKDRTNIVYELAVQASRENFERFHRMIGSSISRKHLALGLIVNSYCQDLSDVRRRAQRKGADAKRRKTIESILPGVVEGVRRLIQDGVKPTHTEPAARYQATTEFIDLFHKPNWWRWRRNSIRGRIDKAFILDSSTVYCAT